MSEPDATDPAAATPQKLQEALQQMPDGPNVEASPWELDAAQGQLPLEGARVDETEPGQDPASGPQAG